MQDSFVPRIVRYGQRSSKVDFQLPCGGGLDILLDPSPDREKCRRASLSLQNRHPYKLALPAVSSLETRSYFSRLKIAVLGEGPEIEAFESLCEAAGVSVESHSVTTMSLGSPPAIGSLDAWIAVLLLFHDHEWEQAIFADVLKSRAFYIGAQGGENARIKRVMALASMGVSETDIARIHSPVGLIPGCKSPSTLALSAFAEIVGLYERLRAAE